MKLTKRSVRSAIELEPILSSFLLLKSSYEQDYEGIAEFIII